MMRCPVCDEQLELTIATKGCCRGCRAHVDCQVWSSEAVVGTRPLGSRWWPLALLAVFVIASLGRLMEHRGVTASLRMNSPHLVDHPFLLHTDRYILPIVLVLSASGLLYVISETIRRSYRRTPAPRWAAISVSWLPTMAVLLSLASLCVPL